MFQKVTTEANNKVLKAWEQNLKREFLWEIMTSKSAHVCWAI